MKSVPNRWLTTSMSCDSGTDSSCAAPLRTSTGPSRERPRAPARELGGEVAQVDVQPFEIGILVGDHLAQKSVEVAERVDLAAPLLRLRLVLLQERDTAGSKATFIAR